MKRFILGLVISVIGVGVIHPMRRLAKVPKQFSSNFRPNVSMSMKRFFSLGKHSQKVVLQTACLDKLSQNSSAIKEDKAKAVQKLYALLNDKEYKSAFERLRAERGKRLAIATAKGLIWTGAGVWISLLALTDNPTAAEHIIYPLVFWGSFSAPMIARNKVKENIKEYLCDKAGAHATLYSLTCGLNNEEQRKYIFTKTTDLRS